MPYTKAQIAKTIDHSLLRPDLTDEEVVAGCEIAARYAVASVCVKPCHVKLAKGLLEGTGVAVGTVIGFPHGSHTTATKVFEAVEAVANGAVELDMVVNVGALKAGQTDFVRDEIRAVVEAGQGAIVKVILEMAYLDQEQKLAGCKAAESAGAHFVKTSTGFAPSGATLEDIRLMREAVGPNVQVKAAGGVRTLPALLEMLEAGATRVGATATITIVDAVDSGSAGSDESVLAGSAY
ncbi:MAG TPA: deoxyribose-phosphate aldolase [Fimbriimonas sp.]|nr:deoxyribose-phosphate aldolase [Fimbriimonas sp.]